MKRGLPFAILILLSLLVVFGFYYKVLFFPNDYMFGDSGDGLKNYFTYFYHINYDSSFIHTDAMNYPYGEHFLYTDCHPLLANTLKLLGKADPSVISHSIGIVNFLMILTIFITFLVMYWILVNFRVNRWFAVLAALGIGLLAPQIFRLEGHLSLSYSAAIPITWALLLLSRRYNPDRIFYFMLFINNIIWLYIHAYLGMILIAFQFAFLVTLLVVHKKLRAEMAQYASLFLSIVVPVFLFYLFASLTDSVTDRTQNPSGFFLYNSELDDVFLPHHPPLRPLLDALTGGAIKLEWEAWSYVGMTITLTFVILLILSIVRLIQGRGQRIKNSFFDKPLLNISLIASVIVLLFAMAIPFKQIPQLLDLFPIFKQFRATGRFAWVFYFVATVFGVTILQKAYSLLWRKNQKKLGILLAGAGAIFMIVEGIPYHYAVSKSIVMSPNMFRTEMLSGPLQNALDRIDPSDYQAIIPLPFYYQGSESYARPRHEETMRASMIVAANTGLPIMGANLTRTSIRQSKNLVQLTTPNFYPKPLKEDLRDPRPFLVVRTSDEITIYENMIFKDCDTIYYNRSISLFSITPEALFMDKSEQIIQEIDSLPFYPVGQSFLSDDSAVYLFHRDFNELTSDIAFAGQGAFHSVKKGKNVLAEFPPGTFAKNKKYISSVWMYNGYDDALNLWFRYIIEEWDQENDIWHETVYFPEQAETIHGDWSLVEGRFKVNDPDNWVYLVTKGKEDAKPPFVADELLVREKGANIVRWNADSSRLFFNNHRIKTE